MNVIKKQMSTTIKLNNSERLLEISEHLTKELNNFIMQTKEMESNEIVARIEMRALNNVYIEYDVDKVTRPLKKYKTILRKLDAEIENFIQEVNNIKFTEASDSEIDRVKFNESERSE